MLGWGRTGAVGVPATAGRARKQVIYQRHAAALYRQALLMLDDSALAEGVVCDVIVNERALARMPERGEDDARHRLGPRGDLGTLWYAVRRRLASSPAAVAEADPLRSRRQ